MRKRYYTFMIDPALADALKQAAASEPELSEGALIREGLRKELQRRGITVKTKAASRRARTRRKASTREQA
ncbi:MAG: hypothetical protein LAO77_24140 [Acidobacteriia bacterium]|nr:hypothetical protein [Terriglobia bacterium]